MFSTGEVWNPVDLASVETPVKDRIKYTKNKNSDGEKEFYGYLKSFNDEEIEITTMIKAREYTITIPKSMIAKIRLAVKF